MRIIAGTLGGRLFNSPHGHRTHPMSDKMRGALFNMLGDIEGLTVLDPFAGSGALAFEAASRGAASVVAIDQDRNAQRTIGENIELLGVDDTVKLVKANAYGWLRTSKEVFDIVLLDPPYDRLQYDLLELLVHRVAKGGTVILSWPGKYDRMPQFTNLTLTTTKHYGDSSLYVYTG
ncbi:MAG TPA: RsmD family RNA methyltransferase [Candidatus Saccharimonadales bacterium]